MMKIGNPKAFDELRGKYWYTLQAASGRLQHDVDWMQEAQAILYQFALTWNPSSGRDFDATLYGLIWQRSDKYYYENFRKNARVSGQLDAGPEPGEDPTGERNEAIDRRWLRSRLREILRAYLDETDQEIVILTFFKNKTQEQIAEKIGMPRRTVSYRLDKALKTLKAVPHITSLKDVLAS